MVVTAVPIMIGVVELGVATRVASAEVIGWIFGEAGIGLALALWRRARRE